MKNKENSDYHNYSEQFTIKPSKNARILGWILTIVCIPLGIFLIDIDIAFAIIAFLCAIGGVLCLIEYHLCYIKVDSAIITKRNFFGKVTEFDAKTITKVKQIGNILNITFEDGRMLDIDIFTEGWKELYEYALSYENKNYIADDFDKTQLDNITIKSPARHIIFGMILLLIGFFGFVLYDGYDGELILGFLTSFVLGILFILDFINIEIRLEGDTLIHKNIVGIRRYLKIPEMTSCSIWDKRCDVSFLYQYDEKGNSKVCKKKLFINMNTKEANALAEYLEEYDRHLSKNVQ